VTRDSRTPPILEARQTGVLLHPTSLPGPHGIGDLGPEARRFVEWLVAAGVRFWQMLPLNPPVLPGGDIPYLSWSTLAGNPALLSLDDLCEDGLLERGELEGPGFDQARVDFPKVLRWKSERLHLAADRLLDGRAAALDGGFEAFRVEAGWARDTALFAALRAHHGDASWFQWPASLRDREPAALEAAVRKHAREIDRTLALQYLFERQVAALRAFARDRGVRMLGDIPIYVHPDSAEVWACPRVYDLSLDERGRLRLQSGTPPDEFTHDGQVWGGPLYDWEWMAQDGYAWWRRRLARALDHADLVRLDHFRALSAAWAVPAGQPARAGRWVRGPGLRFFEAVERHMGRLPLCAEDLGAIDQDVVELRDGAGLPGMRILQYAFGGGADNPHLPHNHPERCLVYPGNHDNDTVLGWWRKLDERTRQHVQHYLGRHGDDIAWDLTRAALASPARLAVIQMQDLLSLDGATRMNDPESYARPRAQRRNWRWRLLPGAAGPFTAERLRFLSGLYGRG